MVVPVNKCDGVNGTLGTCEEQFPLSSALTPGLQRKLSGCEVIHQLRIIKGPFPDLNSEGGDRRQAAEKWSALQLVAEFSVTGDTGKRRPIGRQAHRRPILLLFPFLRPFSG